MLCVFHESTHWPSLGGVPVGPHWGIWDDNANLKPDNAAYLEVK